ncbi:MAG: hypothetical protein WCB10_04845 [Steroidobacteraceae bacterium]
MSADSLTLSRQDLYELAWSKPMCDLAQDFGISDVALAKRLRKLGIPVPGRGYWARVAAGQTPRRPPLPHRDDEPDAAAPTIDLPPPQGVPEEPGDEILSALRARIVSLEIAPATDLRAALPSVKRTARSLKYPEPLDFCRGERSGPTLEVAVSEGTRERAHLLADTFLRAASELGWTFVPPAASKTGPATEAVKTPALGHLVVEGEAIAFRIEERLKSEPRDPTPQELARERREYRYHAPRITLVPTGALRFIRLETAYWSRQKTWYDHRRRRVEGQLREILLDFLEHAFAIKTHRAEREREERAEQEEKRRREALEAKREVNARLVTYLETQAGAWFRARMLRGYLRALCRCAPQGLRVKVRDGEPLDFLHWAESYINAMDPLHATPRVEEFEGEEYSWRAAEEAKAEFSRLSGHAWARSWKISGGASTQCDTDEDDFA